MKPIRKPEWLRIHRTSDRQFAMVQHLVSEHSLHTICQSGKCPNQAECWSRGTATFMIMGDICTRNCKFCATLSGRPLPLDEAEPQHLAESVAAMHLRHVVLTSVTRDDLPDQGAAHWKRCIEAVRAQNPTTTIEVLTADFDAKADAIQTVASAQPDIFAHNLETVRRLTPLVRSRATYEGSLQTLRIIHSLGFRTKTGIMVGLGETEEEVMQTMDDALQAGVSILTIGQYLQPSLRHYAVQAYITPEQFEHYKTIALDKGFDYVQSAPLVRSSYHAEECV